MTIRGWVYIITNKAMPGLVKIGFSTKDLILRANELAHTGSPYPYIVEYDVLVAGPRDIERCVHSALSDRCEGKEWFRCETRDVIREIRKIVGPGVLLENVRCNVSDGQCGETNREYSIRRLRKEIAEERAKHKSKS